MSGPLERLEGLLLPAPKESPLYPSGSACRGTSPLGQLPDTSMQLQRCSGKSPRVLHSGQAGKVAPAPEPDRGRSLPGRLHP